MAYKLTEKLSTLKPYAVNEGKYDICLDANESFININEDLCAKIAVEMTKIALNRYPDPLATRAVEAFAALYDLPPEFVTAGNGSDELISIISSCFLAKGDKVLTLTPDFSMYAFYGGLYELKVEILQKNDDLTVNVDSVIACCNEKKVKALLFSNPCNPTSLGLEKSEVLRIIAAVDCLVIVDEAYMDFWDESILDRVGEFDNLIVLKTCSKSLGLAAVRMGFAIAGKALTSALRAAKSPYNTDSISQIVTEVVLSEKEFLRSATQRIISSKEQLYEEIMKLSSCKYIECVYKSVTNFVFIKTSKADEIYNMLLENSISVRNMNGFLRITAGNAMENKEILNKFEEIINKLT